MFLKQLGFDASIASNGSLFHCWAMRTGRKFFVGDFAVGEFQHCYTIGVTADIMG